MEQGKPLSFELKLTAQDLWKFSMYQMNRGPMLFFNIAFPLAALALLFAAWSSSSFAYKLLLILLILMFTVWQPYMLYRKAEKQALKDRIRIPVQLCLRMDKITVSQAGQSTDVPWKNIARAEQGFGNVFLYLDKIHAYILPDRVTGEQKEALLAMLREQVPKKQRKRI